MATSEGDLENYLTSFETWALCMAPCLTEDPDLMTDLDFIEAIVRIRHSESDIRDAVKKSPEKIVDWIPIINSELKKCKGDFYEMLECMADQFENTFPEDCE